MNTNKSSVEHIVRAQPHSCMLLESCLYVLSMNMFVATYMYAQGYYLQEEKTNSKELLALLS